jgi:hypothetical protein
MFSLLNLLLAHALVTAMMTGVIWFVQIVHYPLFPLAGGASYPLYQRHHERGIARVVVPLMLAELVSGVILVVRFPPVVSRSLFQLSLLLLLAIWISTFLLQVPQHRRLETGFDVQAWQTLGRTNWIRTIAWSLRLLILFLILIRRNELG